MQEIQYKPGSNLWEYKANMIVRGVPIQIFDSCDTWKYIARMEGGAHWRADVKRIIDNFDPAKFGTLFYCRQCRRLEDAAHRLIVAREKGDPKIKTVDVRIGGSCYSRYIKAGRMIRRDSTFLNTFQEMMEKNQPGHKLDEKWLRVCAVGKWGFFSEFVDFRKKSYLDIGCHVGFSCIEAWGRMAHRVTGIDARMDVLLIAESMKKRLKVQNKKLSFYHLKWEDSDLGKFDIVSCLGLLHYFPKDQYEKLFNKLLDSALEAVIIELRLRADRRDVELTQSGIQTLPTAGWLFKHFKNAGFAVQKRFMWKPQVRELWIARRIKCQ